MTGRGSGSKQGVVGFIFTAGESETQTHNRGKHRTLIATLGLNKCELHRTELISLILSIHEFTGFKWNSIMLVMVVGQMVKWFRH